DEAVVAVRPATVLLVELISPRKDEPNGEREFGCLSANREARHVLAGLRVSNKFTTVESRVCNERNSTSPDAQTGQPSSASGTSAKVYLLCSAISGAKSILSAALTAARYSSRMTLVSPTA